MRAGDCRHLGGTRSQLRGKGKGEKGREWESHGREFQGGCGRLWLLTPTSLFSCAAHPLFSLRRFASRRHHPSPPHPYTYLPYSAQAHFCRIFKLKSSHLTSSRLLPHRNRLLIFIHQRKSSSEALRPRTGGMRARPSSHCAISASGASHSWSRRAQTSSRAGHMLTCLSRSLIPQSRHGS